MEYHNDFSKQQSQLDDVPFTPMLFIGFMFMALEGGVIALTESILLMTFVGALTIAIIVYGAKDYRRNNLEDRSTD